jgi:hypothetical protein
MRKLVLLSCVLMTTMSLIAASASAVTVKNEATGVTCSAVTQPTHTTSTSKGSGGCLIRLVNNAGTYLELGGSFGSVTCSNFFEARLNGSGAGFIYNPALTNCNPITLSPCSETAGTDPWPIKLTGESFIELTFCVTSFFTGTVNCHLSYLWVTEGPKHRYVVDTTAELANGHQLCEDKVHSVESIWSQSVDAAHPAVEFVD